MPRLDPLAVAFKKVRDATILNDDIPLGQKIAVLEVVKAEAIRDFERKLADALMDEGG